MIYNIMRKGSPHFLVHGNHPSIKQLTPLGSIITVINSAKTRKKLDDRGVQEYFCGYGNSSMGNLHIHIKFKHTYHAIVKDALTFSILEKTFFHVVDSTKSNTSAIDPPDDDINRHIVSGSDISFQHAGFPGAEVLAIKFVLQPLSVTVGFDL